uniref:WW domain-containing protein n=1 Tax=Micromonas pusilla TaxID=38833 RepID=A0A7S0KRR2_MICPS|mmetsp:Transcript_497/g.1753  ORF Transcript_497/g.1753 Transcript_497/m.1753 type:complete len:132 (+) Transcript_497:350-745(+)
MAARRRHELERWKENAARGAAGGDNPNFTPTVGDWRERVVLARRRREREEAEARLVEGGPDRSAKSAANPPQSETATHTTAAADAAALAAGVDLAAASAALPANWRAFYDASSGEVYYGNSTTGETSWERP